jgi:hypothetical protein
LKRLDHDGHAVFRLLKSGSCASGQVIIGCDSLRPASWRSASSPPQSEQLQGGSFNRAQRAGIVSWKDAGWFQLPGSQPIRRNPKSGRCHGLYPTSTASRLPKRQSSSNWSARTHQCDGGKEDRLGLVDHKRRNGFQDGLYGLLQMATKQSTSGSPGQPGRGGINTRAALKLRADPDVNRSDAYGFTVTLSCDVLQQH